VVSVCWDLWGVDDALPCTRLSDGRSRLWQHDRCPRLFSASSQRCAWRLCRPVSEMLAYVELRQQCRCRSKSFRPKSSRTRHSPGDSEPVTRAIRPLPAHLHRYFEFCCSTPFAWISRLFVNCWYNHPRLCIDCCSAIHAAASIPLCGLCFWVTNNVTDL